MEFRKSEKKEPFKVYGDWGRQSTHLQTRFPELTDEDLEFEEGKEDELIRRIEVRLNKNYNEVVKFLRIGHVATV